MAKKKPLPKSKAKPKAKTTTKKSITNANKKTHKQKKVKQAIRPVRSKGNRKAVSKPNKTRKNKTAKKSVKLVSKKRTIQKRKSVSIIKDRNKRKDLPQSLLKRRDGKQQSSSKQIRTKENKQTNSITFLSGGKPENVSKKFVKGKDAKLIKKYLTKNKPKKGAPSKEPRAIILFVTYSGDGNDKQSSSFVSPDDMTINDDNIDKFINDTINDLQNLIGEFKGTSGGNYEDVTIINYSIKFIY